VRRACFSSSLVQESEFLPASDERSADDGTNDHERLESRTASGSPPSTPAHLKANGVRIEDRGDEIGPEAPGSQNIGVWFYDPDGYRFELCVLGGAKDL